MMRISYKNIREMIQHEPDYLFDLLLVCCELVTLKQTRTDKVRLFKKTGLVLSFFFED